jgi:mono/diheme cytochrome c family protein
MYMRVATSAVLLTSLTLVSWNGFAQQPAPIWSGVYTSAQAERGRVVVQNHCAECHGSDLNGGEGPALVGSTFMVKWETHPVERLFHKIRDTMPSVGSTEVSEKEKLETVAYILQQNGFPAGQTELTDTSPLADIRMVPKGGITAPRSGALVQVIGCLQEGAGKGWALSSATEPQVTTLDPLSAEDKKALAATPAGAQTIELMSVFPSPTALRQHKVLVKGLFIKTDSATRVNVTLLESLASSCG